MKMELYILVTLGLLIVLALLPSRPTPEPPLVVVVKQESGKDFQAPFLGLLIFVGLVLWLVFSMPA
jgi:hypothetical protein